MEDALIFQYYKKALEKHYANVVKISSDELNNVRWNALRLALRDSTKLQELDYDTNKTNFWHSTINPMGKDSNFESSAHDGQYVEKAV